MARVVDLIRIVNSGTSCRGLEGKTGATELVKAVFDAQQASFEGWRVTEIPLADDSGEYPIALCVCIENEELEKGISVYFTKEGEFAKAAARDLSYPETCYVEASFKTVHEAIDSEGSNFDAVPLPHENNKQGEGIMANINANIHPTITYRMTHESGIVQECDISAPPDIAFRVMFWESFYYNGDRVAGFACKEPNGRSPIELTQGIYSDYLRRSEDIEKLCCAPMAESSARIMLMEMLYNHVYDGRDDKRLEWDGSTMKRIGPWAATDASVVNLYALAEEGGKYVLAYRAVKCFSPIEIARAQIITREEMEALPC